MTATAPAFATDLPVKAPQTQAQSADGSWNLTLNQDVRYFSWSGTRGYPTSLNSNPGNGMQVYTPFAAQLIGRPSDDLKLVFLARWGYVSSRQSTAGLSGSVSTFTDTMLSGTATYFGLAGVQPFVSLNINAPTGKSVLLGNSAYARMDPDLVDIATFGEGWNIGPTAGVNMPLTTALVASFNAGYTFRGRYDRESAIDPITQAQGTNRLKPGDVFTLNASLGYEDGGLSLRGSATYSFEQNTTLDGVPWYKTGNRYTLSAGASYAWSAAWASSVGASFTHANNNEINVFGLPALVTEEFNSNCNVYRIAADTTYKVGNLALGPTASYLYRNADAYNPTTNQFVPAKTRWSAGAVAQYAVTRMLSFNARAERVWIAENENPDKLNAANVVIPGSGVPQVSSTGWMLSFGGVLTF